MMEDRARIHQCNIRCNSKYQRRLIDASNPGFGVGLSNVVGVVTQSQRGYAVALTGMTDYGPISGDADVANDFRALLQIVRPDWEEELSRVTGDAIAFEAGRAVKGFAEWAAKARHSIGRSAAEYLTEESRDLAAPAELEVFCSDVDQLASAVERCEAKLKLLREQRGQA